MYEQFLPEVERAGRFVYHVRIRTELGPGGFPAVVTEPPALVLGARWARWKARRMLRAEMRRHCGQVVVSTAMIPPPVSKPPPPPPPPGG